MDLAFVARTIATSANIARSDAVQYADKLNDEESKKAVKMLKLGSNQQLKRLVI